MTLNKNSILPISEMANTAAKISIAQFACPLETTNLTKVSLDSPPFQTYFRDRRDVYLVSKSFFAPHAKIENEQPNYLLDLLKNVLVEFADKIVIGIETTTLLKTSLTEFLSQPDIQASYPIAKRRSFKQLEWKDRLLVINFIQFLNNQRTNCLSSLECGEFSKLISCFKIFIFNEIVDSIAPGQIDIQQD